MNDSFIPWVNDWVIDWLRRFSFDGRGDSILQTGVLEGIHYFLCHFSFDCFLGNAWSGLESRLIGFEVKLHWLWSYASFLQRKAWLLTKSCLTASCCNLDCDGKVRHLVHCTVIMYSNITRKTHNIKPSRVILLECNLSAIIHRIAVDPPFMVNQIRASSGTSIVWQFTA